MREQPGEKEGSVKSGRTPSFWWQKLGAGGKLGFPVGQATSACELPKRLKHSISGGMWGLECRQETTAGDRVGSYVHTYGGSEATRVAEISQRESGLFPGQKPDGCSSNHEKTQEGEQYSTPRVENAFRKTSQSCEILWEEEEVGGQSR